jgi:hypothetical protein
MKDNRADESEKRADVAETRADVAQHRADKAEIRIDHYEQKAAADQYKSDKQATELADHVDQLIVGVKELAAGVAGLRDVERRRNKLLLIASFLVFAFGVLFLVNFKETFENQAILKRQAIVNDVDVLEHRIRKEKCVVRPIIDVIAARAKDEPLSEVDLSECQEENIERLEKRLEEARKKL